MKSVHGDDSATWFDHDGVKRETDKAKLVTIHGDDFWIPKSVIVEVRHG